MIVEMAVECTVVRYKQSNETHSFGGKDARHENLVARLNVPVGFAGFQSSRRTHAKRQGFSRRKDVRLWWSSHRWLRRWFSLSFIRGSFA